MVTTPQPGDFALTRISGITGRLIAAGQWLIGDGSPVQHAYVYVGFGQVVQAMPGGAELIKLEDANEPTIWSTGIVDVHPWARVRLVAEARAMVDTPYSFLDYGSIGLSTLHVRPRFVRDYIADSGHQICSQLVDEAYKRAGVQLFDDGRLPGDVTPGDLWKLLERSRKALTPAVRVDVPWAA